MINGHARDRSSPNPVRSATVLVRCCTVLLSLPLGFSTGDAQGLFDHHIHLLSPGLVRDWKSLGVPFSRPDSFYSSLAPLSADTSVTGGFLLSMAYLYGSDGFRGLDPGQEEEYAAVRRENDFIDSLAVVSHGAFIPFFSANPLRPYALREFERCRTRRPGSGVKLHLMNSNVDLLNADHLGKLREVFSWAERSGTPLVVHLNGAERHLRPAMIDAFLRDLILPHPSLVVIVAHMGGYGGIGGQVRTFLSSFGAFLQHTPGAHERSIYIDISAVFLTEPSEGVEPPTLQERAEALELMRSAGMGRFMFGSDHPVITASSTAGSLRSLPGIARDEYDMILSPVSILKRRN